MNTLLLDIDSWDLVADSAGNIALATAPYALAQDVASAIRTFAGECWYDTLLGIPYFSQILGHLPPLSLFREYMVAEALTVPEVVTAKCIIESFSRETRTVSGQVVFTDTNSRPGVVTL